MYKRNKNNRCEELYDAILKLETREECMNFFSDLCTVSELAAMEQRYQVASFLRQGMIYNEILERTGASSATISRVTARCSTARTATRSCSGASATRKRVGARNERV